MKEIQRFINYVENYIPVSVVKENKRAGVPALVIIEFTKEDWEHIKETGEWKSLLQRDQKALHSEIEKNGFST